MAGYYSDDLDTLDDELNQWSMGCEDNYEPCSKQSVASDASQQIQLDEMRMQSHVPQGSEQFDEEWLCKLDQIWKQDKQNSPHLQNQLRQCFSSVVNPYITALYLSEYNPCTGKMAKSKFLSYSIMKEFDLWIGKNCRRYTDCIDAAVIERACHLVVTSNMLLYDVMREAFLLHGVGNTQTFVATTRELVAAKNYTAAANCVTKLGLQELFDIEDIVLPLILQDKLELMRSYVLDKPDQQVALVALLDRLLGDDADMDAVIRQAGVTDVNHERLKRKYLSKLANKLVKQYNVPSEMCPNITNNSLRSGISFILYRKYIEKSINSEAWDELVVTNVGSNGWLQRQFVEMLLSYQDVEAAARWAHHFHLPHSDLPHQVAELLQQTHSFAPIGGLDNWDGVGNTDESDCYTLPIPYKAIEWVDSRDLYISCMHHLTQLDTVIGFDGEWRPKIVQTTVSRLALLQLATRDRVFLLDIIALRSILTDDDWRQFAEEIFANRDVLKLGYGISGDMEMLVEAFPCMKDALSRTTRIIDLQLLQKQINARCPGLLEQQELGQEEQDGQQGQQGQYGHQGQQGQQGQYGQQRQWGRGQQGQYGEQGQYGQQGQRGRGRGQQGQYGQQEGRGQQGQHGQYVQQAQQAQQMYSVKKEFAVKGNKEKGLSELVLACLGRPLNKHEQMSDWERRPLRRQQVIYAATDAHCLLAVHSALLDIIAEYNIHIPQLGGDGGHSKAGKPKRKKSGRGNRATTAPTQARRQGMDGI